MFAWLSNPSASTLPRAMAEAVASVSPQAVQQCFGEAGSHLLSQVLERLTARVLGQGMLATAQANSDWVDWHPATARAWRQLKWLRAFPRLWIRDSTIITLPQVLCEKWKGMGGFAGWWLCVFPMQSGPICKPA